MQWGQRQAYSRQKHHTRETPAPPLATVRHSRLNRCPKCLLLPARAGVFWKLVKSGGPNLLRLSAGVKSDEIAGTHRATGGRFVAFEQFAIALAGPAHFWSGSRVVADVLSFSGAWEGTRQAKSARSRSASLAWCFIEAE